MDASVEGPEAHQAMGATVNYDVNEEEARMFTPWLGGADLA